MSNGELNVLDRDDPSMPISPKPYLLPFQHAVEQAGLSTEIPDRFEITKDQFVAFLATILKGVPFDEKWYLASNPDIAQAVRRGDILSAKAHFVEHGYIEGRSPEYTIVDEEWYLTEYPDIAEGIELGEIGSAQEHFEKHGRDEGRLPHLA